MHYTNVGHKFTFSNCLILNGTNHFTAYHTAFVIANKRSIFAKKVQHCDTPYSMKSSFTGQETVSLMFAGATNL